MTAIDVADVAHGREVVRDEEHRDAELALQLAHRLRTALWTETSSEDVISSAISTSGRAASARAIATRCR